tara:strand:- start:1283 stop:1489 length:207 start_codon:yes stop_codon:yes gene_type:complete
LKRKLSLTGFKARVPLIDDIKAATPTDDPAVFISALRGLERIPDFHCAVLKKPFATRIGGISCGKIRV